MSFDYASLYLLLWKQMKKRELESNNPNTLNTWFDNNSRPKSFVKLHEALLLVKNHNLVAKDEYTTKLESLMYQTINNKTDIHVMVKICRLIGKYPHLANINEHLKFPIQQVIQLNDDIRNISFAEENASEDNLNRTQIQSSNIICITQPSQQIQHFGSARPTMQQPTNAAPMFALPQLNYLDYFGNENLGILETTNALMTDFDIPSQAHLGLTVASQFMSEAIVKWLNYIKLHKYCWFFNSLSYHEIECIDEDNISELLNKANKSNISNGAKKKICIKTKILRDRPKKLKDLLLVLDLEVNPIELCDHVSYMFDILHYPIPNQYCTVGYRLQQDIVLVMEKLLSHSLEKLDEVKYYVTDNLLGSSINLYLHCTLLIAECADFTRYQTDTILMFAQALKNKVRQIPKNCF